MECKLTILMRALLAVALVAITLVLTYEFWRAGNGKSSLDVQEIRFAGVYQPVSPTAQRTPSTCPACPSQRICQPYPHVIRQANDCLPESCSRTSACGRIAPIGNTNAF